MASLEKFGILIEEIETERDRMVSAKIEKRFSAAFRRTWQARVINLMVSLSPPPTFN